MKGFGPKFVDNAEPAREPRDRARQPGVSPVGSLVPVNARPQRSARGGYAMAAVVVAALAAAGFVLGRLRASSVLEPSSARQHVPEQAASSNPVARLDTAQGEVE